ncbi:uncharacterized protein BX663DRAFT_502056 [Cokeromyces recurvatus]|uniref:uncharacterized protein n=1 Tax=Cokeromyces recurvatus TaxID=90255 RepID=UPI00221E54AA|nr:uncharacterized protein BX663DRAFT_502056 [Cokeromyces recurvatus]KAI7905187.1 hypothetical protein BX663DRAFT_502056 [Cokeromyces recurvatus]
MESQKYNKIAIVTGANSGVGFGICQRLLETEGESLTLIMACRNASRAEKARQLLLDQFPFGHIDIELVDIGSIQSVLDFCINIINKYPHVNYLFCNAGILSALGINWKRTFYLLLTDPVGLLERSDATIQNTGEMNKDGMGKVFACNVFGHYVMMRELEKLLSNSGDGRVIWTSSITAYSNCFDIHDWQGIESKEPYESSKWACDLVSIVSSERFKRENNHIASFTTSPGVVASHIGELPMWITKARIILHYLFRLFGVNSQTITPYNGAIADVYTALEPLSKLNYMMRYCSSTSRWGNAYVTKYPIMDYDRVTGEKLVEKCELAYQAFKKTAQSKLE